MSDFFKDKRIVVTGAAGFLGKYVIEDPAVKNH